jgi:hypothetical protein
LVFVITFSYISLVKSGLTPFTISFLFRLHFCSKLSLSSRNPATFDKTYIGKCDFFNENIE